MNFCSTGISRTGIAALLCLAAVCVTGCHSAFVQATVINETGKPLQLFEVDYPSASFGAGNLVEAVPYHYRFKIIGTGQAQLLWTDAAEHEHKSKGPALHEGEEGTLRITIGPDSATWNADLHGAH